MDCEEHTLATGGEFRVPSWAGADLCMVVGVGADVTVLAWIDSSPFWRTRRSPSETYTLPHITHSWAGLSMWTIFLFGGQRTFWWLFSPPTLGGRTNGTPKQASLGHSSANIDHPFSKREASSDDARSDCSCLLRASSVNGGSSNSVSESSSCREGSVNAVEALATDNRLDSLVLDGVDWETRGGADGSAWHWAQNQISGVCPRGERIKGMVHPGVGQVLSVKTYWLLRYDLTKKRTHLPIPWA